jgi:hypothetical protein
VIGRVGAPFIDDPDIIGIVRRRGGSEQRWGLSRPRHRPVRPVPLWGT